MWTNPFQTIIFGRTAALAAAQKVSLSDRSLEAFRSADIGALIDRLVATSATRAAQTVPAVDVLRRLKRLMDMTERRRNAARPIAGQVAGPPASPMAARDGVKRLPPSARPEFAPSREPRLEQGREPAPLDRSGDRPTSAGLKTQRSDKDRPQ
jgi:hypothetical protein